PQCRHAAAVPAPTRDWPRRPVPRGLLPIGRPCENDCPAVHALADHSSHQRLPGSAHRYGAHSDWSARNRLRREMVMVNRDTSDESAAEKKARDVAAKLDETSATFAGTSNMESHARVGYTEQNVEDRAQTAAEEEGVTLHRNPDGSHTAIDESRAAEATPKSDTGEGAPESEGDQDQHETHDAAVAPGMGAAVGTTREPDDIDSAPGMGNAVAGTAGDDAATGSGSDAGEGTHDDAAVAPGMGAAVGATREPDDVDSAPGMGNAVASTAGGGAASTAAAYSDNATASGGSSTGSASASGGVSASDDTEGGHAPGGAGKRPAGEAATNELGQAD